jgi:hypothetical protein
MKCVAAFENDALGDTRAAAEHPKGWRGTVVSGAIFAEPLADSTLAAAIAQISAQGPRDRNARALGRLQQYPLELRARRSLATRGAGSEGVPTVTCRSKTDVDRE